MSTEFTSGREFMAKRQYEGTINKWTFLEELLLAQLLQSQVCNSDVDITSIHVQYQQLVDNTEIHTKTFQQITRRVTSYIHDNEVFKTMMKEQIRLNWFQ